jgi:lipid-A-disaccharide synthase
MRVFFSVGERSASNYLYHTFKEIEGIEAWGITDERLESIGFKSVAKIEDLSVVGIVEALPKVPFVLRLYKKIEKLLPYMDVLVLCDAPAFNLPLLKRVRHKVKKVIYFISPQVWAWKEDRAKIIAQQVDHLIVLFPFEVEFYKRYSNGRLHIHYVGHPLVDIAKPSQSKESFEKLVGAQRVVGLFPGSRWNEVKRHTQYLRRVFAQLSRKEHIYGVIPTFETFKDYIELAFKDLPVKVLTHKDTPTPAYDVMSYSVMSLIASGTAELEASLLLNPHVVFYQVNPLTYLLGKMLVKVKWISLTNLILKRQAVPEIVQKDWGTLYRHAEHLLTSEHLKQEMKESFLELRKLLGQEGVLEKLRELFLSIFQES